MLRIRTLRSGSPVFYPGIIFPRKAEQVFSFVTFELLFCSLQMMWFCSHPIRRPWPWTHKGWFAAECEEVRVRLWFSAGKWWIAPFRLGVSCCEWRSSWGLVHVKWNVRSTGGLVQCTQNLIYGHKLWWFRPQGCLLDSVLLRFSEHVQQVRDPGVDPEHAGGIMYISCFLRMTPYTPGRSWNMLLGILLPLLLGTLDKQKRDRYISHPLLFAATKFPKSVSRSLNHIFSSLCTWYFIQAATSGRDGESSPT